MLLQCAHAQYNGPASVTDGDIVTYTCVECGNGPPIAPDFSGMSAQSSSGSISTQAITPSWKVSGLYGTIQSSTYNQLTGTSTVTVLWNKPGTGFVQYLNQWGAWPQKMVTVNACLSLGTPSFTIANNTIYYNESTTISATTGTGGTTVRWYTAATGGTHFYEGANYTTPSLQASQTYYISSFTSNAGSGCYSSRIPVTITVAPCRPVGTPQFTVTPACTGQTATIVATPGINATTVRWYSTTSVNSLFHEGTSYTTPALTTDITYYISSRNSLDAEQCINMVPVVVAVDALPLAPGVSFSYFVSNNTTIRGNFTPHTDKSFGIFANTMRWYDQASGGTLLKEGLEYTTPPLSQLTTFYVSAYNTVTGCEGPRTPALARPGDRKPQTVRSQTVRIAGVTDTMAVKNLPDAHRHTSITFLDGLTRPFQQNAVNITPTGKDMIGFVEYNNLGRPTASYLPYVSDQPQPALDKAYKANQLNFYNTPTDKVADDIAPFAKTVFESSPLGRPLEQGSIGAAWQPGTGHTKNIAYSYNEANEVRRWVSDGTSAGFYAPNTLSKLTLTDEDGNHTITYTDSRGRTILKKQQLDETINGTLVSHLETYYIYDDLDRIKFILSPKCVEAVKAAGWVISTAVLDQFTYQFVYDAKSRVIEKKVPGQAWSYFGYDRLNRVVLVQDGFLRTQNKWIFVKYDRKGRPVMTGLYTNTSDTTRDAVQQNVLDPLYSNLTDKHYEERGTAAHGYTNQSFPVSDTEILNVNYYDSYDFDYNNSPDFAYTPQSLPGEGTATEFITDLPTGGKRLILGSTDWIYTYVFYDKDGRAIQTRSNNHLSAVVDNLTTVVYDFEGKVLITKNDHNAGAGKQTTVINKYEHDAKGRLLKVFQNNNHAPADQLAVQYEYNELGQVIDKKLHHQGGANFLQSVDYRYNIRGWLASINNASLTTDASTNDEINDAFGMELLYNNADTDLGNARYFNGNISAAKWKGSGAGSGIDDRQSYTYAYDKAGQLKVASSKMFGNGSWAKELNAINEALTYDHNGNILGLTRNQRQHQLNGATVSHTSVAMDNLSYVYDNSIGDRLAKVEDATGNPEGFNNGVNTATEYAYDVNGSLTKDDNKGITNITYNFLGKVSVIDFTDGRKIEYVYDAAGTKLAMKNFQGTTLLRTTDYVSSFVYENDTLRFFGAPEGRVVNNGTDLEYQYAIADHQGNTRVVLTSAPQTPVAPLASFEGDANDEADAYQNVDPSNVVSFINANNTPGGIKVVRMNQSYKIGPAKTVKVYPGDKVDMEVWEYHEGTSGFGTNSMPLTTLVTMISGAFGGVSGGVGESGAIYNGVSDAITAFNPPGNQGSGQPAAYLNYILFDKNYNVLDMGWQLAPADAFTRQRISFPTLNIREEGFVYVYLSYDNDSNNWVYFDDLKVTHTKTNVIQYNEYYPFGLQTSSSWTRQDNSNRYLYNAGSELNASTGWYEMFYRGYDPVLGRMLQIDPMASSYTTYSPYNYALNSPAMMNDPNGDKPVLVGSQDGWYTWRMPDGSLSHSPAFQLQGGAFDDIMNGPAPHWSEGMQYDDWTPNGGSQTYQDGLSSGMVDVGGTLYNINPDGSRSEFGQQNGENGYYEGYTDVKMTSDGEVEFSYNKRFVRLEDAQQGDPIPGADLIRQYEQNEMLGWGSIFAGQVLIENGAGGKYITKLRKELVEAPMFNADRNTRMVNNILNVTVQAVKKVKGFMPGNKMSDIYFSAAGVALSIKGEMLLYENSSTLAPKILEVNPQWYNDNIAPIFSPQKFGGGGANGDW